MVCNNKKIITECLLCHTSNLKTIWKHNKYVLSKCLGCGLVFIINPPNSEELNYLYSFKSGYMIHYTDKEDSFNGNWEGSIKKLQYLQKYQNNKGTILDVGCSTGSFIKIARDNGWTVKGIDISEDRIEIAKSKFKLDASVGSLQDCVDDGQKYDVITLWDVIEHTENPLESLRIVNSLLKKNGILAIETPNIDGLYPKVSFLASIIAKIWTHPEPPYHLFQFSLKTISLLLKQAGFNDLQYLHDKIPISYSFRYLNKSFKHRIYYYPFSFLAKIGPVLRMGDSLYVFARKS